MALLSGALPGYLVAELVRHHTELSAGFLVRDWEKVLVRGGKMAESVMKLVRFARTGDELNTVRVDREIKDAENDGTLPSEMRTLIPRHARVLYDHRSKRGGGHASFEPIEMDASVVVSVANWILAELLRLRGSQHPDTAHDIATRLVRRPVPLVEEIGGDLMVLTPNVSAREEVAFLLLSPYPARVPRAELRASVRGRPDEAFRQALSLMRRDRHLHENDEGLTLTQAGIAWAEAQIRRRSPAASRTTP